MAPTLTPEEKQELRYRAAVAQGKDPGALTAGSAATTWSLLNKGMLVIRVATATTDLTVLGWATMVAMGPEEG